MDEDQVRERFWMENDFEDEQRREISKLSAKRRSELSANDIGTFKKYGNAMKIMETMGYKGGGLGKNEQGIVAPIEVKLHPKYMGMGFNKENSEQQSEEKQQPVVRKKIRACGKKKERHMTVEESQSAEPVLQKVIDMRGPQIQVLTNLESLNAEDRVKGRDAPMQELQHNIRFIVDLTELEMRELDRKLQQEKVRIQEQQQEKARINNMKEMLKVLDHVNEANSYGKLALDSLAKSFEDLQMRFPDDYETRNLTAIAYSYALPLFITTFQGWEPLRNPSHGRNLMLMWKNLLQKEECIDYYTQLVKQVVLPAVRVSGINTWQARDPESMLRFLEHWDELLPFSVRESILDMIVMPKLSDAVDSWNPRCEATPIHAWILPWRPWMGEKLERLYEAMIIKFGSALRTWHPSDGSAFIMLEPWKTVFDPRSWEHIIVKYIITKLCEVMQEFIVNPAFHLQNLDEFNWVMKWASAIPIHHMANLLEVYFFRKWHWCLYSCLTKDPNFEEVAQWYLAWKDLFPLELEANERIRLQLNIALDMMNQAVEGLQVTRPGQWENTGCHKAAAEHEKEPEMSLMEIVAIYANEHNLLFMPKHGRLYKSRQIHGFGNVSIIVDSLNQKIYAQAGDKWSIVSLEVLLQLHNLSGSSRR